MLGWYCCAVPRHIKLDFAQNNTNYYSNSIDWKVCYYYFDSMVIVHVSTYFNSTMHDEIVYQRIKKELYEKLTNNESVAEEIVQEFEKSKNDNLLMNLLSNGIVGSILIELHQNICSNKIADTISVAKTLRDEKVSGEDIKYAVRIGDWAILQCC